MLPEAAAPMIHLISVAEGTLIKSSLAVSSIKCKILVSLTSEATWAQLNPSLSHSAGLAPNSAILFNNSVVFGCYSEVERRLALLLFLVIHNFSLVT